MGKKKDLDDDPILWGRLMNAWRKGTEHRYVRKNGISYQQIRRLAHKYGIKRVDENQLELFKRDK